VVFNLHGGLFACRAALLPSWRPPPRALPFAGVAGWSIVSLTLVGMVVGSLYELALSVDAVRKGRAHEAKELLRTIRPDVLREP